MKKTFLILLIFFYLCSAAYPQAEVVLDQATDIGTDVSQFNNNLSSADTDVQKALETLDNFTETDPLSWLKATDQTLLTGDKTGNFDLDIGTGALLSYSLGVGDGGISNTGPLTSTICGLSNSSLQIRCGSPPAHGYIDFNETSKLWSFYRYNVGAPHETLTSIAADVATVTSLNAGSGTITTTGALSASSINITLYENEIVCVNNDIVFS